MSKMRNILLVSLIALSACDNASQEAETVSMESESHASPSMVDSELMKTLKQAKRIPSSSGWFEIISLPNNVYAFWEPGHADQVNSFLIIGETKDVLYDTGMGIASIKEAIADIRKAEGMADKDIMVVNSHNHLDHNGGNEEFEEAWIYNNKWGIEKLTNGVPAGVGFESYWDQIIEYPGVKVPSAYDPMKKGTQPFSRDKIHLLVEGDVVDLGNRKFKVIHTTSHTPDGLALYDEENQLFFGGDTFYGPDYLISDINLLEKDLEKVSPLKIKWHYSSHGAQLIETMQHGLHLSIVKRILVGEGEKGTSNFAGFDMPLYSLDGVTVALAGELILY